MSDKLSYEALERDRDAWKKEYGYLAEKWTECLGGQKLRAHHWIDMVCGSTRELVAKADRLVSSEKARDDLGKRLAIVSRERDRLKAQQEVLFDKLNAVVSRQKP